MANRILVPVDDSEVSKDALRFALSELANSNQITIIHVVNPVEAVYVSEPSSFDRSLIDRQRERAQQMMDETRSIAAEYDIPVDTEVITGSPAREIVDYASENDVDHIVIGSHGRTGMSRVFLGSVAEIVVRRSPVPVTVVR